MAARCPNADCGWVGTASQVYDGGRCPECFDAVFYDGNPKASEPIASAHINRPEFLRRVLIAFRGVDLHDEHGRFLEETLLTLKAGQGISRKTEAALCRAVIRHKDGLADQPLIEYAERNRG